jgi:hypothetical protein
MGQRHEEKVDAIATPINSISSSSCLSFSSNQLIKKPLIALS